MAINPPRLRAVVEENEGMLRSHSRPLSERLPIPPVAARTLDQHVAQLRKKIEASPDAPSVIATVHGGGYRYDS